MIWIIDIVSFAAWIVLAGPLMITAKEQTYVEEFTGRALKHNRRKGFRDGIAVLAMLPIVGHLLAIHGWIFALIFLLVVNAFAFMLRFTTDGLPTWVMVLVALTAVGFPGYSYLWL